jgi:hypothetical protein
MMFRDVTLRICKRKFLFFYTCVYTVFSLSNDISLQRESLDAERRFRNTVQ